MTITRSKIRECRSNLTERRKAVSISPRSVTIMDSAPGYQTILTMEIISSGAMVLEISSTLVIRAFGNLNNIYWKETKPFADGCSAHVFNSFMFDGTLSLPDSLGSFIIEDTTLEKVMLKGNHHCGSGTTGFLCMPQYVLHNVTWRFGKE